MEIKKIFISYSWDSEGHKEWALKLANQLEEYFELHITLDQYDLDSFEDKNYFPGRKMFIFSKKPIFLKNSICFFLPIL